MNRQFELYKKLLASSGKDFQVLCGFYGGKQTTLDRVIFYGLNEHLEDVVNGSEYPRLNFKSSDADSYTGECTEMLRQMLVCRYLQTGDGDASNDNYYECKHDILVEPTHLIQYEYEMLSSEVSYNSVYSY